MGSRDPGRSAPADQAHAVERQVAALRRDLQREHAAYLAGHAGERQSLEARHAAENRQLSTADDHRVAQDRLREQQERRAVAPEQERVAQRERGVGG